MKKTAKFKKLLFPTDFSPVGNASLPYAVLLASVFKCKLVMLHAMTPAERLARIGSHFQVESWCREELARLLDETLKQLGDRLPARLKPVDQVVEPSQNAGKAILSHAKLHATELVVMSTHGRGGLFRKLTGSVAEQVIRRASCPVVALRFPAMAAPDRIPLRLNIRRILVPTDLSPLSLRALDLAAEIASAYRATLVALHVVTKQDTAEALMELEDFIKANYRGKAPLQLAVLQGNPADKIASFALRQSADLIVMTTQGRNEIKKRLFGSTAERVLRITPCPLLVVK